MKRTHGVLESQKAVCPQSSLFLTSPSYKPKLEGVCFSNQKNLANPETKKTSEELGHILEYFLWQAEYFRLYFVY